MKRQWMLKLIAAAIAVVIPLGSQAAEDVQVGLIAPLSGPAASYGQDLRNGASLAVEEINAAGGIDGRKLVLHEGDDRGSPKDAANVAQSYVSNEDVVAMIGGATSTATFGAVPVAQRGKLPFLITLASHPDLTKEGEYIFRNSTTQELEGPEIARLAAACLGAKSVGILHLNNDWALAMTGEFKKSLGKLGVEVTSEESYNPGENIDYTAKLSKVKASNPDIIWFGSQYNDLALILKQAQRVGLEDIPHLGSAGVHSTGLIKVAGDAANGLYLHTLFFPGSPNPKVQDFASSFREKYGQEPNLFSAQAYDSMHILARAIQEGGFTRDGTRDALLSTRYEGVQGSISFDPETREALGKTFTPLVVRNEEFTLWEECQSKLRQ